MKDSVQLEDRASDSVFTMWRVYKLNVKSTVAGMQESTLW